MFDNIGNASGGFQKFKVQLSQRILSPLTDHENFHNAFLVPYSPCTMSPLDERLAKIIPCTSPNVGMKYITSFDFPLLPKALWSFIFSQEIINKHPPNVQKIHISALTPVLLRDSGWVLQLSSRRLWFSGRKQNMGTIKMFAIVFLQWCLYSIKKSSRVSDSECMYLLNFSFNCMKWVVPLLSSVWVLLNAR